MGESGQVRARSGLAGWLVAGAAALVGALLSASVEPLRQPSPDAIEVSDFAYHVILTQRLWAGGERRVYTPAGQRRAIEEFSGRPSALAMPVGATPVGFVLWAPFAAVASASLRLAQALFVALSWGLLALLLLRALPPPREPPGVVGPWGLVLVWACSGLSLVCAVLGQTTPLAAALLLGVWQAAGEPRPARRWPWVLGAALLAVKPPYLVLAGAAWLLRGRWREGLATGAAAAGLALGMTGLLGGEWFGDYLATLRLYQGDAWPPVYAWAIKLETSATLRSAARPLGVDGALRGLSSALWLGAALAVLALSWRRTGRGSELDAGAAALPWAGLCWVYLLCAPYLGAYEDLLVLALVPLLPARRFAPGVLLAAALVVNQRTLLSHVDAGPLRAALLLGVTLVKLGLAAWWLRTLARPGASDAPEASEDAASPAPSSALGSTGEASPS